MQKIKILTGWSDIGGSTVSFINLCNAFNQIEGYECTMYGSQNWFMDKCRSDKISNFKPEPDDIVIGHFLDFPQRLDVKKMILSCKEKDVYPLKQHNYKIWDVIHFVSRHQFDWHGVDCNYFILPNIHDPLLHSRKSSPDEPVAGIIGSIDKNKQTHISIQRALEDGFKKIVLYGKITDQYYYNSFVKPILKKYPYIIKEPTICNNKQEMYESVTDVYQSSLSETWGFVRGECKITNTKFHGNRSNDNYFEIPNEKIISKWIDVFENRHVDPRTKKEKVLLAGPWFGEFGWELMAWQGYIRKVVEDGNFDRVIIGCRPGREVLYEDFATEFKIANPDGNIDCIKLNGNFPRFDIKNTTDNDITYIQPTNDLCLPISLNLGKQKFRKLGSKIKTDIDILIHARSREDNNIAMNRNWPVEKWNELVSELSKKYKIASIGSEHASLHIKGTINLRGIDLSVLVNYMNSVKMVLGPSSGPMHLASLCGCNHIVWTDSNRNLLGQYTNRQRYEKIWNPLGTEVVVIDSEGWQPSVKTVLRVINGKN